MSRIFKHYLTYFKKQPAQNLYLYIFLVSTVSLILYWRYPNVVTAPNFYAEDGGVFLQNIIDKGVLRSIITPFNGYFVVGLYLLCDVAIVINDALGAELIYLARTFSIVSIVFMASIMALPFLLFRKKLGTIPTLITVLMSALVPLPASPHTVIGTIGNLKWLFFYLAFLLVIYRVLSYKKLNIAQLILLDGLLVICAYTNTVTYTLLPLVFIPYYGRVYIVIRHKFRLTDILNLTEKTFLSACSALLFVLPQIVYVAMNGIPKMPGYLDNPYQFSKTIEIFINRTYLFGLTNFFNGYLSNILVVMLFIVLIFLGLWRLRKQELFIFLASLYAAGMASIFFVINRPGVSDHFFGYRESGSGPDQFFYTQTLIMWLPIVLIVYSFVKARQNRSSTILSFLLLSILIFPTLANNLRYDELWRTANVLENDAGTFIDNSLTACTTASQDQGNVKVALLPFKNGQFSLVVPKNQLCKDSLVNNYQPTTDDLHLVPTNNDYFIVNSSTDFEQTFTAKQNHLQGIRLFVSSFNKNIRDTAYKLTVYDASCKNAIRTAQLPRNSFDNSYQNVTFEPIDNSQGSTYCFTVSQLPGKSSHPIALQQSAENVYLAGILSLNKNSSTKDIVFMPLFSQNR